MGFNIARKLSDCKYFYNIYLYILIEGYKMIAKTCENKYLCACSQRSFICFMAEMKCSTAIGKINLFFPLQGMRKCSKNKNTFLLCPVTRFGYSALNM